MSEESTPPSSASPNDRYEILEQLGVGGAGSVFKVWDHRLQRHLAIKRLLPADERTTGGDLIKEAAALSALQHPNIVSVYDLDEWDGQPCLLMEFLNGENLDDTVRRGKIEVEDFLTIVSHCLEGLKAAHSANIQHRDIKPSNIMVTWLPDGNYIAKMLDFGLAEFSVRPRNQITNHGQIYGSVHFMAPEQFHNRPVDGRTDLYSLGCVCYYLLVCRFPFDGKSNDDVIDAHLKTPSVPLLQFRPDVPPLLAEWVHWLMERRPENRPQSVVEALRSLHGIVDGTVTSITTANRLKTQAIPARMDPDLSKHTAPHPRGKTATVQELPDNRKKWIIGGSVAAATIITLGLLQLSSKKKDSGTVKDTSSATVTQEEPKPKPKQPPYEPVVTTQLPQAGLMTHVDGDSKLLSQKGTQPAEIDGIVDLWQDRAPYLGGNDVHYLHSRMNIRNESLTLLRLRTDEYGLRGEHRVLEFAAERTISLFTAETPESEASLWKSAEIFKGASPFTIALLFRTDKKSWSNLIVAGENNKPAHWLLATDNHKLQGEVGTPPQRFSVPLAAPTNFNLVFLQRENGTGTSQIWAADTKLTTFTTATQTSASSTAQLPLDRLRVGRSLENLRLKPRDFSGDIAMILVYDRALTEADRVTIGTYVGQRYFGR